MNKKIFSVMLALILLAACVLGLTGCADDQDTNETSNNGSTTMDATSENKTESKEEDTAPATQASTEPSETTEPEQEIPELEYAFAPIYKSEPDKYGVTHLWLALEFKTLRWDMDKTISVINTKTGEELTGKNSLHTDVNYWDGKVCQDNHYEVSNIGLGSTADHDCEIRVLEIEYEGDIDFEDLKVSIGTFYRLNNFKTEESVIEYEINADISEISTKQPIIHGYNLFEVGGKYYILEGSGIGGNASTLKYSTIELECINGTAEELAAEFEDRITLVYNHNAWALDDPGYTGDEKYLQPIEIPSHCTLYLGTRGDSSVHIGFEVVDGSGITDEDRERVASSATKYVDSSGYEMIFLYD